MSMVADLSQPRVSASSAFKPIGLGLACLLLFASGFSSLIFQVVWIRQLSTVAGVDIYAVSAGVTAFMGGLGVGSLFVARLLRRFAQPLRLYAMLELGVCILGVLVTLALPRAAGPFVQFEAIASWAAWPLLLLFVFLPATLMGGTLPAVLAALAGSAGSSGRLYAANTFGAVCGALFTTFLLIPVFGLTGTALVAGGCSLGAAAVAILVSAPGSGSAVASAAKPGREANWAVALYAIAGGIALGYEVVWTQSIVQFMSTRAFAFSVVLATYLAGLVIGSAVMSTIVDRLQRPWSAFGILIGAAGAAALLEIVLLGPWIILLQSFVEYWTLSLSHHQLAAMSARFAVAALCIVFVPTVLLGAAFPVVVRIVACGGDAAHAAALTAGWNTLGGIVGSLLAGFVFIPRLGAVHTLGVLAVSAGIVAVVAAIRADKDWRAVAACAGLGVVSISAFALAPQDRFVRLLPSVQKGELVFYDEGLGGTVAVVEQRAETKFRRLYIQGVSNTGDSMSSLRYMRLQALVPLITMSKEPRSVLVIGLGTGITAGATLIFDGLDRRVAAELLPGVRKAVTLFSGNNGAGVDPRLDIRVRDGRRELLSAPDTYDLVTLEPPPPSASGVANLYSTDFYRLAASRLTDGGVVAQWLPLPTQNQEDTRALVKSFTDVFPHASLYTTELHEMMLVGSMQPMRLDYAKMLLRFDQSDVKAALAEVGISSIEAMLATWVTDRDGLVAFAGDVLPVTDDDPAIEFAAWVRPDTFPAVLPEIMRTAKEPPVVGMPDEAKSKMSRERQFLYAFYQAGLAAYADNREEWQRNGLFVMENAGDNPYYRWFFTAGAR